jgi:hypothetical protein
MATALFMDMHWSPQGWMIWKRQQQGFGNTEQEKKIQHAKSVVKEIDDGLRVIHAENARRKKKSDVENLEGDNRYAVITAADIKALGEYRTESAIFLTSNTSQGGGRRRKKTKRRKSTRRSTRKRKSTKKRRTKKRRSRR